MEEKLKKIKKEKLNGVAGGHDEIRSYTLEQKRDADGNVYYVVYNDSGTVILRTHDREEAIQMDRDRNPGSYGLTVPYDPKARG